MLFVYYSFLVIGIVSLVLGVVLWVKERDSENNLMYAFFISAIIFLGIFITPAWKGIIEPNHNPSLFHEDMNEIMNKNSN